VDLQEIVAHLHPAERDPNLLIGFETSDDAGVYRLSDDVALVQTVDFITPLVDDPFIFGQVAASNSLSDIYAMGGRPLTAMNLCCFPQKGVSKKHLAAILEGALERVTAAGAVVVGGHTVMDPEMKFGLSVTGTVHPKRILANAGARAGDRIILTKPIGTGVIIGGLRKGKVPDELLDRALGWMIRLNDSACRVALEHATHGATDITGFGFAGHSFEVAKASKVGLVFHYDAIPRYREALELIRKGIRTINTPLNRELVGSAIAFEGSYTPEEETLLFDPQTSGGLLLSVPADRAEACLSALHAAGDTESRIVGEAVEASDPLIRVVR
jgi:selenide,water dikinase